MLRTSHLTKHFETGAQRQPVIRAQIVALLATRLALLGLDVRDLLRDQEIEAGLLQQRHGIVDLRRYIALFEAAALRSGNHQLGFDMGLSCRPEQIGPLGLLFVLLPTLREAMLAFGSLLSALQSETSAVLQSSNGDAHYSYRIDANTIWPRRQDSEFTLGILVAFSRARLGANWTPRQVEFEHPASPAAGVIRRKLGCPVLYEQPLNRIVFDPADLDVRLSNVNTALIDVLQQHLVDLIGEDGSTGPWIKDVAKATHGCLSEGRPCLDCVAQRMGTSGRSLQRGLRLEGWTFRRLLDHCRSELVETLRTSGRLSREATAQKLGYADATSLSRSRRRWTSYVR